MIRPLFLIFTGILLLTPKCEALEEGFYLPFDQPKLKGFLEIENLVKSADRKLSCRGVDEIDLGFGMSEDFNGNGSYFDATDQTQIELFGEKRIKRWPIYFSRAEILHFLMAEKHKKVLLIVLRRPLVQQYRCSKKAYDELSIFSQKLSYERFLILVRGPEGYLVLKDSQEVGTDKANADSKNGKWWLQEDAP